MRAGEPRFVGKEALPRRRAHGDGAPEPLTGKALARLRLVEPGDAWAEFLPRRLSEVEDFVALQRRRFAERRARAFRT